MDSPSALTRTSYPAGPAGRIPLLIDQFLHDFTGSDKPVVLPGKVLDALYRYDWPGNIRELQNVLRRYLAIKRLDFIEPSGSTPAEGASADATANSELPLHQMVAMYIRRG